MFTVEMDHDGGRAAIIITLDQSGEHDDVEVLIYDDEVYIQQHDDEHDSTHIVILSTQQWLDILAAMNLTDGAYYIGQRRSV